ncbi:L,D-transpeptidase family protein [Streptomyces sp. NPDC004667]|uniref:L,D-transpeptidase family protein n=1 Tax=Streptomyces sp. NPDC004667 TaxID=3154285 RepID=UPI0033B92334
MTRLRTCVATVSVMAAALLGSPSAAWAATDSSAPAPRAARAVTADEGIPGLGAGTRALVPAGSRQVIVVTGASADSDRSALSLYEHGASGWTRTAGPWPAHNGLAGWTHSHRLNDLRSPSGVYGLTDAGGWLPDPGTSLPYDASSSFRTDRSFAGKSMRDSFGYVIAVNYNRRPGTSPLDNTKPLGTAKGGGIWLHVDAGAPTQGCVSVTADHMRDLLRRLDPADHPVVAMGTEADLAR